MKRADKYESRLYSAMIAFIFAVVIDVAVNGGLPVAQALLQRYDLPLLNDRMLSGVFGLAAIAFACAMLYFYACFRIYNPQLWLNIETPSHVRNNWAKWLELTLGSVWVTALAMMCLLVVYLSASDAIFVVRNVAWHIAPTDWETLTNPGARPR